MACEAPRITRRRALIGLTVGAAVLEVGLLLATGREPALGAHALAPPPYGTFHDLRWLLTHHPNAAVLLVEVGAAVVLRGVVVAAAVRAAWPRGMPVPGWRALALRGMGATALFLLVLVPWAGLLVGMGVTPVSWLWLAGVVPVLVLAPVTHQAAVGGVRFRRPTLRSAAWSVLTFLVVSLGGAAITLAPTWWLAVGAAAATGLFHAWAWLGVVHALVCRDGAVSRVPVAPLAAATFTAVAIGVSALAFDAITGGPPSEGPAPAPTPGDVPVLVAGGFGSGWDGTQGAPLPDPYRAVQFSYRGLGEDGEPLPYTATDTHVDLPTLAVRMGRQVEALARRSGGPVHVVAQSEGSLVAEVMLATEPPAAVGRVVLLSPLLHPAQVAYPPAGTDGWGVGGRWALEVMTGLVGQISPYAADPDLPFLRSIVANAPAMRRLAACVVDGRDVVALVPVVHGLAAAREGEVPTHAVAAFHAGFLGPGHDTALVAAALSGGSLPGRGPWTGALLAARAFGAGWQVPRVPLDLPAQWRDQLPPPTCDELGERLRPSRSRVSPP